MTYALFLKLEGLPKNANARMHWRARATENKRWETVVFLTTRGKLPDAPLLRAKLTCVRHSSVPTDADNIVAGFKPILDGLVTAGVLENDKWANIGMPDYRWEKCPPKKGHVTVTVEEINT